MKIGVGISTHNRRDLFNRCYSEWINTLPKGSVVVVVDDASQVPCPVANTRFETQQGIAKSKNECIRLLLDAGCTHLFLSDDDVWPRSIDSLYAYINSGLGHASLSFQHNSKGDMYSLDVFVKHKRPRYWAYNWPNGCLMYMKAEAAKFIGWYDESFGLWGLEHVDYSIRMHQGGFTPFLFTDIPNGIDYFHSMDYYGLVESSVPESVRRELAARNHDILKRKYKGLL